MTDAPDPGSHPDPAEPNDPAPVAAHASRRVWWWVSGGVIAVLAIVAALVFQPWLLFIDVRVDDEIPAASGAPTSTTPTSTPLPEPTGGAGSPPLARDTPMPSPAGPVDLASGALVSHEHETSGTVRVIQLPDGSRQLAIEDLETTNGPDVHVWARLQDGTPRALPRRVTLVETYSAGNPRGRARRMCIWIEAS